MKKSALIIVSLLTALAGSVHAQAPAAAPAAVPVPASPDPIVQMRAEQRVADKAFSEKKKALNSERDAKVKAAGQAAMADAKAKGKDPLVVQREAESKVKASTKVDHDAKIKVLKKEHSEATAAIRKNYPAANTR